MEGKENRRPFTDEELANLELSGSAVADDQLHELFGDMVPDKDAPGGYRQAPLKPGDTILGDDNEEYQIKDGDLTDLLPNEPRAGERREQPQHQITPPARGDEPQFIKELRQAYAGQPHIACLPPEELVAQAKMDHIRIQQFAHQVAAENRKLKEQRKPVEDDLLMGEEFEGDTDSRYLTKEQYEKDRKAEIDQKWIQQTREVGHRLDEEYREKLGEAQYRKMMTYVGGYVTSQRTEGHFIDLSSEAEMRRILDWAISELGLNVSGGGQPRPQNRGPASQQRQGDVILDAADVEFEAMRQSEREDNSDNLAMNRAVKTLAKGDKKASMDKKVRNLRELMSGAHYHKLEDVG